MVERKPIWQVLMEEGHSRESADTATINVDTRERIVLFARRPTEDPEAEAMENNAHSVAERSQKRLMLETTPREGATIDQGQGEGNQSSWSRC